MPLNYKPVSKIKIKRGPNAGILSHILDDGELAWSTDLHRLYVGDSSTPGGILVNIDNTSTLAHPIGSTTTLTPYHTLTSDVKKGMVLKAGIPGDTVNLQDTGAGGLGYMGHLNFYDIKFNDARHWLHDHGMQSGLSIPISTTTAFTRSNTTGHTFPVYTAGNTWSGDTTTAYGVTYASAMDYTSAIQAGTDYAPVATYESSQFKIKFKSVPTIIQDAFNETSITLTHDILDHSSSQTSHIVYANESGNILGLQYNGAGDGAVLKYNTSTGLNFGKLRYRDLTGAFIVNDSTDAIFKPLQVYALDSTTRMWGYNKLARLEYGDPSDYPYLPQHSEFKFGRHLIHYFSKPENAFGYTPAGLYYSETAENAGLPTTAPYVSDTKLYISSWDELMYGSQNSLTNSGAAPFKGAGIVHLHGLNSSIMQFETRSLGGFIGLFSPTDSSQLDSSIVNGSTRSAFAMMLASKKDCPFRLWTRGHVTGTSYTPTITWAQYGTSTSYNSVKPTFEVNKYGGIKVGECYMDTRFDLNEYNTQYSGDDEAAAIHVIGGVNSFWKFTGRPTSGIKLNSITSKLISNSANSSSNNTIGIDINTISSSTEVSLTQSFLGKTSGVYIDSISGANQVAGIWMDTISSTSTSEKVYGIRFDTIEHSTLGGAAILFDTINMNRFAHGILFNEIHSDTTAVSAITIGPRDTSGSCSTYGMWITNKDIRGGASPDRLSVGTNYSILVDNSGGEFYFGDGGTIAKKCIFGAGMDVTGDSTSRNNFLFTSTSGASATVKLTSGGGYLKIDTTSCDLNDVSIDITGKKSVIGGVWNHGGSLAIKDPSIVYQGSGHWSITDSSALYIDAAATGILTFSADNTSAGGALKNINDSTGGAVTITHIGAQAGTAVPTAVMTGATSVYPTGYDTSGFALGQILVITGSDAGVWIQSSDSAGLGPNTPHGKFPIILNSDDGIWIDEVGNSLTLMFNRVKTTKTQTLRYQYYWQEIGRCEATPDLILLMVP